MRARWTTWTTTPLLVALWTATRALAIVSVTVVPAPISVTSSQTWSGNDGPWSSFALHVGTPPQVVYVFPSTKATTTWVVATTGCQGDGIPSNCTASRGGTFNTSQSTTWVNKGDYGLFIEDILYPDLDQGYFGFDTVGLGYVGSGSPTLINTTVTWINTFDFWIGEFGLNPRPTNFTSLNDNSPSYLSLLYESDSIPSLTYGYTAGAQYRFNEVVGSLVLGGYDSSLFEENNITIPFYFDQTLDLTLALLSISATNTTTTSLLPNADLYVVDPTISQLWLPIEACQAFEEAFGLVYDNTSELYLVSDALHTKLLQQNSTITFTVAPLRDSTVDQQVNVTFPYAAFDLQVSYPYVTTQQRYFPLKRAANSTQYVLGRTFLQEAYLRADYHRQSFSVSQRVWSENAPTKIVSVFPPGGISNSSSNGTTTTTTNSSSKPISSGAIAGIVIGAVVVLALIGVGIWFYLRQKRRKEEEKKSADLAAQISTEPKLTPDPYASPDGMIELGSPIKPPELHGTHYFSGAEVDGTPGSERRFELGGPDTIDGRVELEAPHGIGELHNAEIQPPPPFSPVLPESGSEKSPLPARGGSDPVRGATSRRHRPFSWQRQD